MCITPLITIHNKKPTNELQLVTISGFFTTKTDGVKFIQLFYNIRFHRFNLLSVIHFRRNLLFTFNYRQTVSQEAVSIMAHPVTVCVVILTQASGNIYL